MNLDQLREALAVPQVICGVPDSEFPQQYPLWTLASTPSAPTFNDLVGLIRAGANAEDPGKAFGVRFLANHDRDIASLRHLRDVLRLTHDVVAMDMLWADVSDTTFGQGWVGTKHIQPETEVWCFYVTRKAAP